MNAYQALLLRIRRVRRKWRMQAIIKGLSLFLISAVATLVLGVWGADLFGFRPPAVWLLRLLTGGTLIYVALRFMYLPWRRRVSDVQVAQYIEERYPQLEDRLVTAVEFGQAKTVSPGMLDLLIKDALEKAARVDLSVFVNWKRVATYGGAGLAALVALMALLNWGPSFFPYGFKQLYFQWTETSANAPLLVQVLPGNMELAKGTDQQITAQLLGFDSPEVTLHIQPANSTVWSPLPMEPESRGSGFRYLLVDIQSSLSYYVESRGIRSSTYNFKVVDLPRVERIDLTYNFPVYTRMSPQTVEDEGDISAMKGTKVDLKIKLTQPVRSGKLVFDDQSKVALVAAGDRVLAGSLTLQRSGSYSVQLVHSDGRQYMGSSEYQVEVIEDEGPKVTVTKPLRDLRATNVEEVFSEIKAEDDIGVERVQLHFSVNGGEEKVLNLFSGKTQQNVTATHTFFLEEFNLQPGDVISYYGRAFDGNRATGPGASSSDIYFIQIRPFDQKYVQNQSPRGAGGGGGGEEALSKQQKEIISATFKLVRDKDKMEAKEYIDGLKSLALIQSRLQAQAQGLVERLQRRGAGDGSTDFAKLAEYLKNAIAAMEKAAIRLGAQEPKEALPEEQKALQQLMRAEALFKEIQVSLGNSAGGGGGSQASAEDLADLFELELNKLKNQYETVQRGEQQAQDQQVDEAMQRLKELAQRQQQINERNRLAGQGGSAGSSSSSGSSGGSQSQEQLMEEARKLQRQLERLSRERSSPELNRVSSHLQQAIEQMKRATERGQRGNSQEATAQGIRALQQLESARRGLAQGQDGRLNQEVEQAANESSKLVEEQKRIQEGAARIAEEKSQAGTPEFQQRRNDLAERKTALAERVKNLANQIDDLSKRARKTQRDTSNKLGEAAGGIRDKRLPERILQGNQLLESGYYDLIKSREDFVRANLEELQKQLQAAKNSIGQTQAGKLEDAVEKTRQLAEGLEAMQQRLRNAKPGRGNQQPGQRGQPQGRNPGQEQGQQGEGGQGGAQAGSQNSQGQSGQEGSRGQQRQQGRGQQSAGNQGGGGPQGGPQQVPSGGRPQGDVRGLTGNAQGAPIGIGPYSDEDLRQLRRETQQRILDTQELRRLMDRNSTQAQNLEQVMDELRKLDTARNYSDPEEVARLKAAIDLLRQVELDLSRELAQLVQKEKYFYSDDNEAPARYKKLVEEYYKVLARGKP